MPADLRREGRLLLAAVEFLTRLPVPAYRFDPDWLPRGAKYFPLVGMGVGAVAAALLLAGSQLWPTPIPALLAVGGAILLTGAFHEDGLADSADSLGGTGREARLAIMRDSRIGTYGALALLLVVALRVAALAALPAAAGAAALLAAGTGGRLASVVVMRLTGYADDPRRAKVAHGFDRPRPGEVAVAAVFGLAPLLLLPPAAALAALGLGAAAGALVAWRLCRALGGHTGDVLGAVTASAETAILLGACAGAVR